MDRLTHTPEACQCDARATRDGAAGTIARHGSWMCSTVFIAGALFLNRVRSAVQEWSSRVRAVRVSPVRLPSAWDLHSFGIPFDRGARAVQRFRADPYDER